MMDLRYEVFFTKELGRCRLGTKIRKSKMDLNMEALNIGCGNKHWSQSDIDLIDWLHNKPGRYGAGCSGL